jgi:hypothetical protein
MQRVLLLAWSALSTTSAACAAISGTDSQLWSELDVSHALDASLSATGIATARLGDALPNPTLSALGLQLDYRLGPWTASATGYDVRIRSAPSGLRTRIWLPAAALAYELAAGPLRFADRNRVEILEGIPGAPRRYRNRASIYCPVAGAPAAAEAFLTDEVFYDFSRQAWTRNRAQLGLQFRIAAPVRLQLFFLRQDTNYGLPRRLDVLGTTLQLDIG